MIRAAGVLLLAKGDRALFLKRGPRGDAPGCWCFPGGKVEGDETDEQAARRECQEETGLSTKALAFAPWTRAVCPPNVMPNPQAPQPAVEAQNAVAPEPVDFTTFVARVAEEFEPKGDDEHVGYAWAPVSEPPQPLHPGCQVAVDRLSMDELGVARAISEGRLTSPQTYENVSLFAIRITGTGAAYRQSRNEYVWRDPEIYLNPEFLQRCNGLAVIMEHPKGALLNSKEFNDRSVGAVLLPFVRGDEVWGVAKIYDARRGPVDDRTAAVDVARGDLARPQRERRPQAGRRLDPAHRGQAEPPRPHRHLRAGSLGQGWRPPRGYSTKTLRWKGPIAR
jgi:8-oxo-dGTP pyrophosphatase MutT (NUDIX family)